VVVDRRMELEPVEPPSRALATGSNLGKDPMPGMRRLSHTASGLESRMVMPVQRSLRCSNRALSGTAHRGIIQGSGDSWADQETQLAETVAHKKDKNS
jgi:hypothetical protein